MGKLTKMAQWMSIGDAARHLGVSRDTLRRWEKAGKITPQRSPTNRRYYTKGQLDEVLVRKDKPAKPGKKPIIKTEAKKTETKRRSKKKIFKLIGFGLVGLIAALIISLTAIAFLSS